MEPRIQYVRTSDGVNIAYATLGRGHPLVLVTPITWIHSIEMISHLPPALAVIERLAERRMVVLCDNRGQGVSQRDVDDLSALARTRDLAAVVEALQASTVDLMSLGPASLVSIRYAVDQPGRVSHLIISSGVASGNDFFAGRWSPTRRALQPIAEVNWDFFVEATVLLDYGWEMGGEIAEMAKYAVSREAAGASYRDARKDDVTDLLSRVACPTLVVHVRSINEISSIEASRRLAAAIPGARLIVVAGGGMPVISGWEEGGYTQIEEFLDQGEGRSGQELPSGTAVILFADIADSTVLTERLGDAAFRAKARELGASLRALIRERGGTPVEGPTLGDGVLAVFTSAREAIEAARRCGRAGDDAGLPLHLGLHAGDVSREKDPDGRDNVYGGAVNVASRISGLSAPGEVLVSDIVRGLARTSGGVSFDNRGRRRLKGVGEPVRAWAVREGGE